MLCTENDFTSDFWEQSPVNERSNALELLVLVTLNLYYYGLQFVIFMFLNQNVQFDSFIVFTSQD